MNTPPPETDSIFHNSSNPSSDLDMALELLREIRDDEVNAQDEADKFLRAQIPSELSKVRRERDEARKINIQLILERDRYKTKADERIALRREVELLLGMESKEASEEQFVKGLNRLRKTIQENAQLRKVADELANELKNFRSVLCFDSYNQLPHVIERNTQ